MSRFKKYISAGIFLCIFALAYAIYELPDSLFHLYFLDVDQGDSILIKTPRDHHILVDGGPKAFVLEQLGQIMPFFEREIDLMVLTHPHADHIEGLVEVLKRYKVRNVLMTGVVFHDDNYKEFLKEVSALNIPVFTANSKTDFIFDDVLIDVLYPFKSIAGETYDNVNNSSVGLAVVYKNKKILLFGDMEKEIEQILLAAFLPKNVDIYKASHHGSKTASSIEFLEKISPKEVVIQVGKNNQFKHPHAETIRNFYRADVKKIYRTDIDGRVEFTF
ncbi:MAG: MBL fold metallo-hydrolase [Candidatus Gracilibacteria bacterium]|jgi:competence protein ComEC